MAGNNNFPTPSGTISMSNINSALGQSSTASISFNDARVRFLANQDSGSVSMSNMRNQWYSDGTMLVQFSSDGKGNDFYFGNTSPSVFNPTSFSYSQIITDATFSGGGTQISVGYLGSNIGIGGRTLRLQINNTTNSYTAQLNFSGSAYDLYAYNVSVYQVTAGMVGGTYAYKIAST